MEGFVVYTGGTFDLPHVGHVDLLNWCRKLAGPKGKVIVSLNRDDFVKKYKGEAPMMKYKERYRVLNSMEIVDKVIPNTGGKDSRPAILEVQPDIVAIGSDWLRKDYMKQMHFTPKWLEDHGIALIYIPRQLDISSSGLKRQCS